MSILRSPRSCPPSNSTETLFLLWSAHRVISAHSTERGNLKRTLWVLMWALNPAPQFLAFSCIRAQFCPKMDLSITNAGVRNASRGLPTYSSTRAFLSGLDARCRGVVVCIIREWESGGQTPTREDVYRTPVRDPNIRSRAEKIITETVRPGSSSKKLSQWLKCGNL